MTNREIRQQLEMLAEQKYRDFSQALIPGSRPILGVRIPKIRELAKEIAKGDWKNYLDKACDDSFEEVDLQGFVIGYVKADYEILLPYIKNYVTKINDWSLCDGFCASLKIVKKHKKEIKDVEKFIIGNITPDIIENKEYSHYHNKGKDTINFDKFLHDKNIKIDEDYYKGYLLHLLADETFYYYYFK